MDRMINMDIIDMDIDIYGYRYRVVKTKLRIVAECRYYYINERINKNKI